MLVAWSPVVIACPSRSTSYEAMPTSSIAGLQLRLTPEPLMLAASEVGALGAVVSATDTSIRAAGPSLPAGSTAETS